MLLLCLLLRSTWSSASELRAVLGSSCTSHEDCRGEGSLHFYCDRDDECAPCEMVRQQSYQHARRER
jgi:hypothetical protein